MKYARTFAFALAALGVSLAAVSTAQAQSPRAPQAPGETFDPARPVAVPKAVADWFASRRVFTYGTAHPATNSPLGGFGYTDSNLGSIYDNLTPQQVIATAPAPVRAWYEQHYRPGVTDAQLSLIQEYGRHVDREATLNSFLSQWGPVVRTGSDQELITAINADPAVQQGLARYMQQNNWGDVSQSPAAFRALRAYMADQVALAEVTWNADRRYIDAFLRTQADIARNERALREAGGEWLIEGEFADDWITAESEAEAARALSEMERIEAQIRARLEAMRMPDLTDGRSFTSVPLEQIYNGYDPLAQGAPWVSLNLYPETPSFAPTSLSAAGNSLSSAGNSLSAAGTSLSAAGSSLSATSDGFLYIRSQMGSGGLTGYASTALADLAPDLAEQLYGALWSRGGQSPWVDLYGPTPTRGLAQLIYDRDGRQSAVTDPSTLAGFLDDQHALELIALNDLAGLERLLAQPFNVLVTWGGGMYDLDLHMTGPTATDGQRFHIYYAAAGDLNAPPYAQLIQDCVCTNGSEVMLTTQLEQGGVYRISTFNFGDQSATSTQMSDQGGVQLMIVRGGEAVAEGQGTTIVGGHVIFQGVPETGQAGNTWVAVEIDPSNGRIYFVDQFTNSAGSGNVQ